MLPEGCFSRRVLSQKGAPSEGCSLRESAPSAEFSRPRGGRAAESAQEPRHHAPGCAPCALHCPRHTATSNRACGWCFSTRVPAIGPRLCPTLFLISLSLLSPRNSHTVKEAGQHVAGVAEDHLHNRPPTGPVSRAASAYPIVRHAAGGTSASHAQRAQHVQHRAHLHVNAFRGLLDLRQVAGPPQVDAHLQQPRPASSQV